MPFLYDLREELPLRGLLISDISVDHFAVIVEGLHAYGKIECLIWKTDGDVYVEQEPAAFFLLSQWRQGSMIIRR